MTSPYTFIIEADAAAVQAAIDANGGRLVAEMPQVHTRGFETASAGDGAVVRVAGPADGSSWIGQIVTVERTPAVTRFLISIR